MHLQECRERFCVAGSLLLHRSQKMIAFFVAGATLWRPPSSFCVACAALQRCRFACVWLLHFPFQTLHFTLLTPDSTLSIPNLALHIPHFTLYTPNFTQYTPHFTLDTVRFTLRTLHFVEPLFGLRRFLPFWCKRGGLLVQGLKDAGPPRRWPKYTWPTGSPAVKEISHSHT